MDKIFIVCGEKSGDQHAAEVLHFLKKRNPNLTTKAWGGEALKKEGAGILKNYTELAFMGFIEVLKNLFTILGFLSQMKKDILAFNPDAILLVDYAGFNLRVAAWAHTKGIKVYYFIAPKTWVWNESRVKKIKKYVDHLFVIFPFEEKYFRKFGIKTSYVGNPVVSQTANFLNFETDPKIPIIAFLPGSRKQEILAVLPVLKQIASLKPNWHFKLAAISDFENSYYGDLPFNVKIETNNTFNILQNAHAAVVTSGTATLETALIETPQVVVYKTNLITYYLAKFLVKIPYISLVNIVAEKEVVKELIQKDFNAENVLNELNCLLFDNNHRKKQLEEYKQIKLILEKKPVGETLSNLIFNEVQ